MDASNHPLIGMLRERIASDPNLAGIDLLSLALPAVRLVTEQVPLARIGIGESRIGGVPDVPADFEWPRWMPSKKRDDKYGQPWRPKGSAPLGFIAQIDSSDDPAGSRVVTKFGLAVFLLRPVLRALGFRSGRPRLLSSRFC